MPFRDLDYAAQAARTRERPFDGELTPEDREAGALFITYLYPELANWLSLLERLLVPLHEAAYHRRAGQEERHRFPVRAAGLGRGRRGRFFPRAGAGSRPGLRRLVDPERLIVRDADAVALLRRRSWHNPVKIEEAGGISYLIAPERIRIGHLRTLLARYPGAFERGSRSRAHLARSACARSRTVLVRNRARLCSTAIPNIRRASSPTPGKVRPWAQRWWRFRLRRRCARPNSLGVLHVFFSLFFLACICLRFAAIRSPSTHREARRRAAPGHDMPVYSMLVALYDEADMVPGLLEALDRIVWPKSKLEIKLVCEADDRATLAAIHACKLPPSWRSWKRRPAARAPSPRRSPMRFRSPAASSSCSSTPRTIPIPRNCWRPGSASASAARAWPASRRRLKSPTAMVPRCRACSSSNMRRCFAGCCHGWRASKLLLPLGGTSNHFRRAGAGQDRRLGPAQRHRGCRSRPAAGPLRLSGRDDLLPDAGGRARGFPHLAAAAHPMVQGLDADLAGAHAQPAAAGARSRLRFLPDCPDPVSPA